MGKCEISGIYWCYNLCMKVGILRESKRDAAGREVENRVVLVPAQIAKLTQAAEVLVEKDAGAKNAPNSRNGPAQLLFVLRPLKLRSRVKRDSPA